MNRRAFLQSMAATLSLPIIVRFWPRTGTALCDGQPGGLAFPLAFPFAFVAVCGPAGTPEPSWTPLPAFSPTPPATLTPSPTARPSIGLSMIATTSEAQPGEEFAYVLAIFREAGPALPIDVILTCSAGQEITRVQAWQASAEIIGQSVRALATPEIDRPAQMIVDVRLAPFVPAGHVSALAEARDRDGNVATPQREIVNTRPVYRSFLPGVRVNGR